MVTPESVQQGIQNGLVCEHVEVIGDGQWTVMSDGTILGQRTGDLRKLFAPGATPPSSACA